MKKIVKTIIVSFCIGLILMGCGGSQKALFDDFSGKMTLPEVRAVMGEPNEELNDYITPRESVFGHKETDIEDTYYNIDLFGYEGKAKFLYSFSSEYPFDRYDAEKTVLKRIRWSLEEERNFTQKEYDNITKKITKKYGDPSIEPNSDDGADEIWYDDHDNIYKVYYEYVDCYVDGANWSIFKR